MRRGVFGNSCRNCAALVPAYLFSGTKILNGVAPELPELDVGKLSPNPQFRRISFLQVDLPRTRLTRFS